MVDLSGDIDKRIIQHIYRVGHKCMIEIEKSMEEFDITFPQSIMMHIICVDNQKDICQKDIADFVGTKESSISSLINNLCKKGLVERKKYSGDARKYAIKATNDGINLHNKMVVKSKSIKLSVFNNLTESEKNQLLKILLKIL